jgi:predicted DNA-binding protein YlxM (UPF0122 family)
VSDFVEFMHTPLYRNQEFLHQKYVVEGLSLAQISEMISSSKEAVRAGLKRCNIQTRKSSEPHGRLSQDRFGQKSLKGKVTIDRSEQRVINAILSLHSEGLSLRQIAKTLSSLKFPTKCNGQNWHPQMVKRILIYAEKDCRSKKA